MRPFSTYWIVELKADACSYCSRSVFIRFLRFSWFFATQPSVFLQDSRPSARLYERDLCCSRIVDVRSLVVVTLESDLSWNSYSRSSLASWRLYFAVQVWTEIPRTSFVRCLRLMFGTNRRGYGKTSKTVLLWRGYGKTSVLLWRNRFRHGETGRRGKTLVLAWGRRKYRPSLKNQINAVFDLQESNVAWFKKKQIIYFCGSIDEIKLWSYRRISNKLRHPNMVYILKFRFRALFRVSFWKTESLFCKRWLGVWQ